MTTLPEMNLTRMLDRMAGDMANDLEWALDLFDSLRSRMPESEELAERYVKARLTLKNRRAYEEACDKTAELHRHQQIRTES